MTSYILFAIPFFLLMMGLEILHGYRQKKKYYRFNDTVANLSIGIGSEATGLFFKLVIFGSYIYIYQQWAFFHIAPSWWSFLCVLILYDFCFYWAHRMLHSVNIFWGAHVVHHSSEEYNLSVALRQSWFESMLGFFIFIPIPLLGFDPVVFVSAAAFDSLYQFWIHTQAVRKMPQWYEKIFNTPSHHRVHHARNPQYIDKNYGGIFIIWDKLFGSFQKEEEECIYGITTPLNSWNPVWANLHYYAGLFSVLKKIKSPFLKLRFLFARPGWMPEEGRVPKSFHHFSKYNAKNSWWMHFYIVTQFILIISGLMAYMVYFEELPLSYQWILLGILLLSIVICGGILENKIWVIPCEYLKLSVLLLTLNVYYYYHELEWFTTMLIASSAVFIILNIWFTFSWKIKGKISVINN